MTACNKRHNNFTTRTAFWLFTNNGQLVEISYITVIFGSTRIYICIHIYFTPNYMIVAPVSYEPPCIVWTDWVSLCPFSHSKAAWSSVGISIVSINCLVIVQWKQWSAKQFQMMEPHLLGLHRDRLKMTETGSVFFMYGTDLHDSKVARSWVI